MRDIDIRQALRRDVERAHQDDPETRIIDELGLRQGSVLVDVAVVNGVLHGFEIKSLHDTLRRLPTQVDVYGQVLDFATIVLAEKHREDALELVPEWWQVIVATDQGGELTLVEHREGMRNSRVSARALAELLWHEETVDLLKARGAEKGCSRRPRAWAWDRLCEVYSTAEIGAAVRARLKDRASRRAARPRR